MYVLAVVQFNIISLKSSLTQIVVYHFEEKIRLSGTLKKSPNWNSEEEFTELGEIISFGIPFGCLNFSTSVILLVVRILSFYFSKAASC